MSADTPHDALFKFTFGVPEHAAAEFRAILPAPLVAAADWSSLRLEPTEHAAPELGRSDLLYSVALGESRAFLYLLFEHQSSSARFMAFRLLRYIVGIWTDFHAAHPGERLPAVIPIVLHHSERGWTAPRSLLELIELPEPLASELVELLPNFRFVLDDISHFPDPALRNRALTALGRATLLAFVRARNARSVERLRGEFEHALRAVLHAPHGVDALNRVLGYIVAVSNLDGREFRRYVIETLATTSGETAMSTADNLIELGRSEGLATGRVAGRADVVLSLLTQKFGPLSDATRERVERASPEELDGMVSRLLAAPSLEAVLG